MCNARFFVIMKFLITLLHDIFSILPRTFVMVVGSFASESDWKIIVWNNKEIRIDNKPVYYKNYFKSGIIYIHDLLFNLNTMDSYNYFSNKIVKSNFLQWAGLRHSVPSHLKEISVDRLPISPSLIIGIKSSILKTKNRKIITCCWFPEKLNLLILSAN